MVIIGGGLTGTEEAYSLAMEKGKNVAIVEASDHLINDDNNIFMHKSALLDGINKCGNIKIHLDSKCTEITDEDVAIIGANGKRQFLKADTVIIAIGYKALEDTVMELRDNEYKYAIIGDCLKPANIMEAVHGGYFAGMRI